MSVAFLPIAGNAPDTPGQPVAQSPGLPDAVVAQQLMARQQFVVAWRARPRDKGQVCLD